MIWSLLGPSLLDCEWSPAQLEWLPEMSELLASPEPSNARSARLGLVFEHLWHHWLQQTDWHWDANIQISSHRKTLGELDLLLHANATTPLHLELALKFYAGIGTDWIGPNRKDYLADKLHHTRTRQLPLVQTDAARPVLDQLGWSSPESLAVMRGCLFYPANNAFSVTLPDDIAAQHWRGYWCHHRDIQQLLPSAHWYLLAKDEWISPAVSQIAIPNTELQPLLDLHFRHLRTPVCLGRMASGSWGWGEIERWFIMPDHWPTQPESSPPL